MKDSEKESLLDGFRKEIVIVCGPSIEFILAIMECLLRSKEMVLIEKLSILSKNIELLSNFDGSMEPGGREINEMLTPI